MRTFESWQSYLKYEHLLKKVYRYIHPSEVNTFLQIVLDTSKDKVEIISKNSIMWRAQNGHDWRKENEDVGEVPAPYNEPKRMCPLTDKAKEGRANPKGIPYLYLASNKETALSEVRPWIGAYVSVGQFKILKDIKVVNCTTDRKKTMFYFEEPSPKEREEAVWADIDKAFSKPISPSDDVADYVPTQVIAELFKANGFDGIGYRSSLCTGYNIALFNIKDAELINCSLFEVTGVKFDFAEAANPFFVKNK